MGAFYPPKELFVVLLNLVPILLCLQCVLGSPYNEDYGGDYEPQQAPVLKRHYRRTHMPIIYKHRPPQSFPSQPMMQSMGEQYQQSSHGIALDMDWRGWLPAGVPPHPKSHAIQNSEPSYEPSYESDYKPKSVSRMYFKKYRPQPPPNHMAEMNNEEPIEIGAGPPQPSASPSVADLYRDLQDKRRNRRYRPFPSATSHPIMLDFREHQPFEHQGPDQGEDEPQMPSMYPNFDDDQSLYGYNNYFRRK